MMLNTPFSVVWGVAQASKEGQILQQEMALSLPQFQVSMTSSEPPLPFNLWSIQMKLFMKTLLKLDVL